MQFKSEGKEGTSPRPHRPQPTQRTFHAVKRSVEQNPQTTAADVAKMIEKNPRTVVRYPHALGYRGRAARKSRLRPFNLERRKYWGSEMISKPLEFWDTVVFSDETPFAQFSDSGRIRVWRQEFSLLHLQPTVKFGGFLVMVWGAIWTIGRSELVVCDGSVNAENTSTFWTKDCYLHFIVESCVIVAPFSCKMELLAILQKRQRITWQKKK